MRNFYLFMAVLFAIGCLLSWFTGKGNVNEELLLANSYMILYYVSKD